MGVLECGDKLDIRLWSEDVQGISDAGKHYTSMIFDIPDDKSLLVTMPTQKGKLILMPVERRLSLVAYSKKSLYIFSAKITERFVQGNVYLMRILITSKLTKYQRRSYYRWECCIPMEYRVLPEDIKIHPVDEENLAYYMESVVDEEIYTGTMLDLSGGGVRFTTPCILPEKSVLMMCFTLENDNSIFEPILLGRLLHCDPTENPELYECRTEFQGISEVDREIIIKFIFEAERRATQGFKGGVL